MGTITLAEAAKRLNLSPETLRWQIRNGKLRAKKFGHVWTVTDLEVERYRRDNRKGGKHNPIMVGVDECPLGDGCPVCSPAQSR